MRGNDLSTRRDAAAIFTAMSTRNVRGTLFADYVRMIRSRKGVDWFKRLEPEDLGYLEAKIDPRGWYPMAVFERLGNAILGDIANMDLDAVRMWGSLSVDQLRAVSPSLVAEGDPVETMMRFRVQRATYFDFEAIEIPTLIDEHAVVLIHYFMGPMAEEAASYQTMGFFERLLEVAGATEIDARFAARSWNHPDQRTRLELTWKSYPIR
jgi:hypothetical protein